MKKLAIRFTTAVVASFSVVSFALSGVAFASSINTTGPGSVNIIIGGSSGSSISTTGPGSVNIIKSGFTHHHGWCCWWCCW